MRKRESLIIGAIIAGVIAILAFIALEKMNTKVESFGDHPEIITLTEGEEK